MSHELISALYFGNSFQNVQNPHPDFRRRIGTLKTAVEPVCLYRICKCTENQISPCFIFTKPTVPYLQILFYYLTCSIYTEFLVHCILQPTIKLSSFNNRMGHVDMDTALLLKLTIPFFIPKILTTFAAALVRQLFSQPTIKRESGENPEQSRCCKLFTTFRTITFATVAGTQSTVLSVFLILISRY